MATWKVGTSTRRLVTSRRRQGRRWADGEDVYLPVGRFHAVHLDPGRPVALCGAPVSWVFSQLEFGTRSQNCPRCQVLAARGGPSSG